MIIPLSTDLRLGRQPWVTWAVIAICIVVFWAQYKSNAEYSQSITNYCQNITDNIDDDPRDVMRQSFVGCATLLDAYHSETLLGEKSDYIELHILETMRGISKREFTLMMTSLRKHYAIYSEDAPKLLDMKLMYFPESFNPITMITSSLAHGDWGHIIGNLIFFFAFSPAIELLVGGAFRYVLSLTVIAVGCSIFYSIFALAEGGNIPSLGLSGVVMGVIGMSAYLMPHARINTFVWFIVPLGHMLVPAWFMAIWFIGFDAWELLSEGMNQGINLVAHVSGGAVGYFIGWFFFKARKEEVQEELDAEIKHMQGRDRSASISSTATLHIDTGVLEKSHNALLEKIAQGAHLDNLFNLVRTNQSSEAINLILADTDPLFIHPDHFKEMYEKVGEWKKHQTYICMGRLMIDLYMQHQRYVEALKIAKDCFGVTRDFTLANPRDVLLLAQESNRHGIYKLSLALLDKVEERYSKAADYVACGLLEVNIFINHVNASDKARKRLEELKLIASESELKSITALEGLIVEEG